MVYLRPRHRRHLRRQKTLPIKKVKIIPKRRFTLPKIGQPFINRGKIWQFCAQIAAADNPIKVIHEEFGMNSVAETSNGIYLRCKSFRRQNIYNCPRKGIFHKANGCLYTIGKHEHQDGGGRPKAGNVTNKLKAGKNVIKGRKIATMKQIPRQQQNNHRRRFFVDQFGKQWNFLAEIGRNIPLEQIRVQYGLSKMGQWKDGPIYLQCRKVGYGSGGRCAFAGIYTDGCLFTRGQHKHKYQLGQNVRKQRKANNNGNKVGTKRRKLERNVRKRPANNNGRNVDAKRRKLDNNNLTKVVINVQIYEPPQNNAIHQQQQNNIVEEIVANNNLEQQNVGGGIQQQEQNGINLAALEPDVEIVADINLGKWLPHIKKEPEIREFPILTIHDDNDNLAPNAKLARVKNEVADPEEEPPRRQIAPMPIVEVNHPPQIAAQNQMPAAAQAPVQRPQLKMLLRERKIAINYGK